MITTVFTPTTKFTFPCKEPDVGLNEKFVTFTLFNETVICWFVAFWTKALNENKAFETVVPFEVGFTSVMIGDLQSS